MPQYIELRGHQVYSYQYPGNGDAVLLLHGGLSHTASFDHTVLPAIEDFNVFGYDRTGHGFTADRAGSFHYESQYEECIAYLEDVVQEPAHLIGYSDGAVIALMVAIRRPELVKSVVSQGGVFHHEGTLAGLDWDGNISPEDQAEYNSMSPDAPDTLAEKIRKSFLMWNTEPDFTVDDVSKIKCPVLVIAGDDDVINHHHTVALFEAIENARLAIVPAASHRVNKEKPEVFQALIKEFLADLDYPQTTMPQRRNWRP